MKRLLLGFGAAFAASCAHAQSPDPSAGETATPPPPPACEEAIYRQFDFWAGDWEVFTPDGAKAGDNAITVEEKGCLLVERWAGAKGGTGQSYNYVDHEDGKWRQIWVSAGATIDYEGGLSDKGEMVLEGTIAYPNGKIAPFRGTWTPNPDGSVTQYFQEYDPDKDVWTDWFTGIYKLKAGER